jgi:hypothetical protein
MEVSRSEDNQPMWSKYYNANGKLWLETQYNNGITASKKVYAEEGTAEYRYANGNHAAIEYTSAVGSTKTAVTYNIAEGFRHVHITEYEQVVLNENLPLEEQVGTGLYQFTEVPVANPFGDAETNYQVVNQSFFSRPGWEGNADPNYYLAPYRLPDALYTPGSAFATRFALSTEVCQSVIEQYPVTENEVLLGGSQHIDGYHAFKSSAVVRDFLAKVRDANPELYELKYGNEFLEKVYLVKSYVVVGAIRNMPTESSAANKVKNIARKHMYALLSNGEGISSTEQEILNKVWFEIKFFSTLKIHQNRLVIDSYQAYDTALKAVNNSG